MRSCAAIVVSVALLSLLLLAGCGGGDGATTQRVQGTWAHLYQEAPGDEAVIRLHLEQPSIPLKEQIFAWLFYRAEGQRYFSLTAQRLVDVVLESHLPAGTWDDAPGASGPFDIDEEFTWISAAGEEETGTMQFIFFDDALQRGRIYYHRVQRVVEPMERAGSGAPIATSASPAQAVTPVLDVDPPGALSEGSLPTAGVTYFTPPVLESPAPGARNQPTASITFRWNATLGADEYLLQVFREDDPSGLRHPEHQMQIRRASGGVMSHTIQARLAPGETFYWRVGARRAGEALPETGRLGQRGWLFSSMRSFATAAAPPAPPGT
ncbi:MAG: hypothetical protein U9R79_06525 [Armatimonadota bacterium]|nr:hypothetical protein [Armatimonadota bacterium]